MPRQGRINIKGGIYHVIQRGIEKRDIFRDNNDREQFLHRLGEGLKETKHKCYGWVLMPNHFHLLIRTSEKPLSDLMRKLLTGYALYFNKKYERSGYLYQNRYKSILCQEEEYLLKLIRYIHLNPLRAKLVKDMNELDAYKWCGHSVIIGEKESQWQSTGDILKLFGECRSEAIMKYREFVNKGSDEGKIEKLTGGGVVRSAGGWKEMISLKQSKQKQQGDERILGDGDFVERILKDSEEKMVRREKLRQAGWDIHELIKYVCKIMNIEEETLMQKKKRDRRILQSRGLLAYWAIKELGISGMQLGQYLGVTKQAVAVMIKKGERVANENKLYLSI